MHGVRQTASIKMYISVNKQVVTRNLERRFEVCSKTEQETLKIAQTAIFMITIWVGVTRVLVLQPMNADTPLTGESAVHARRPSALCIPGVWRNVCGHMSTGQSHAQEITVL